MTTTFSDQQYDMCYPPGIEHHWWTTARNRLLADILQYATGDTDKDTFLEVGCGRGLVVKGLRDRGLNIYGVELADVDPVEGAHSFVDTGTDACDWAIERGSEITGLLLLDVIEHLPDPEQFLKKLEGSFPNLAVVVITVPTCQELWSNYDTHYGHYRRYTLEMLETLARDLSWTTQSSGYFFRIPYLPMRLMSLLGVERNLNINAPGKAMRPMHRLVSSMSYLEQAIVPRRVKGSSAYAVYYPDSAN
jgi:hypothetical protein